MLDHHRPGPQHAEVGDAVIIDRVDGIPFTTMAEIDASSTNGLCGKLTWLVLFLRCHGVVGDSAAAASWHTDSNGVHVLTVTSPAVVTAEREMTVLG